MINTKFIKIIIAIVIILVLIFTFLLMKNNNITNTENTNSTSTLTGVNGRPVLNTNPSNTNISTGFDAPVSNIGTNTNVDPVEYTSSGPEDALAKKIEKILFDWTITKDQNLLREALILSENTDNEAVLTPWIPFMKTDSAELIKLINTSTDAGKTKKTINTIFQWFIELSGEYEKLSSGKRQQITNQYNQTK